MKKADATSPEEALDAMLDSTDVIRSVPGSWPDLTGDAEALTTQLAPLLDRLPEAAPPLGLFDAIEAQIDALPEAPVKTVRADEGKWRERGDKVWVKGLAKDPETGRNMYLLRCLPGATIKPHFHDHAEHLFIIEGEFWIDNQVFSAGDTQISAAGTVHGEIYSPGGCLVLVNG